MEQFLSSVEDSSKYPLNLLVRSSFGRFSSSSSYKSRLDARSKHLCAPSSDEPLRIFETSVGSNESALSSNGPRRFFIDRQSAEFAQRSCYNQTDLRQVLWKGYSEAAADPMLRIFLIRPMSSRSKLNLTQAMLEFLLSYHQVMPSFLEFVLQWGRRTYNSNIPFITLRSEFSLSPQERQWELSNLGRSGFSLQYAFGLKSVDPSSAHQNWEWSIRPFSYYHSFDVKTGRSVWIMIRGDDLLHARLNECTHRGGLRPPTTTPDAFEASMNILLMLCELALENWHQYIHYLDEKLAKTRRTRAAIDDHRAPSPPPRLTHAETVLSQEVPSSPTAAFQSVRRALSNSRWSEKDLEADLDAKPPRYEKVHKSSHKPMDFSEQTQTDSTSFEEVRALNYLEEGGKEAQRTLAANQAVLTDLCEFYASSWSDVYFPEEIQRKCQDHFNIFRRRLSAAAADFKMLDSLALTFLESVASRKLHSNNIITWKGAEASTRLTRKAQHSSDSTMRLSEVMLGLTMATARETSVMKIVTLVTLFFLPGTFISTFLSTDIVKFKQNSEEYSPNALRLFFTLCIPLMALTFLVAGVIYWWATVQASKNLKKWQGQVAVSSKLD